MTFRVLRGATCRQTIRFFLFSRFRVDSLSFRRRFELSAEATLFARDFEKKVDFVFRGHKRCVGLLRILFDLKSTNDENLIIFFNFKYLLVVKSVN